MLRPGAEALAAEEQRGARALARRKEGQGWHGAHFPTSQSGTWASSASGAHTWGTHIDRKTGAPGSGAGRKRASATPSRGKP